MTDRKYTPAQRRALMERAIEERNLRVILQGIAVEHPTALAAPEELRRAALDAAL